MAAETTEIDMSNLRPGSQPSQPEQETQSSDLTASIQTRTSTLVNPANKFGVYPGLVIDVVDPSNQGRVRVRFPWALDPEGGEFEAWARLATLMAGPNRGSWFIPDIGDEVLVTFEAGNPAHPYVIGSLWNGQDAPPGSMDGSGDNNRRLICSRSGLQLIFNDAHGQESLELHSANGQKLILTDMPGSVEILTQSGSKISVTQNGVEIVSPVKVTITAGTIELDTAMLTVNAGMAKFSGVVQADTLIANAVVSASYTPGAGNIW